MPNWLRKIGLLLIAFAMSVTVIQASSAVAASAAPSYPLAWTGIGFYPQNEPQLYSGRAAAAIPDRTMLSIECEVSGSPASNNLQTSSLWDKLATGGYVPNVFINTGVDGRTPGMPSCGSSSVSAPPSKPAPESKPAYYDGTFISASDDVVGDLLKHYLGGSANRVIVDWRFFSKDKALMSFLRGVKSNNFEQYASSSDKDGDVYWAIGAFSVYREAMGAFSVYREAMGSCYVISDRYEFRPDKLPNIPFLPLYLKEFEGAKPFDVRSSGCL